jgi:hypothetical protein
MISIGIYVMQYLFKAMSVITCPLISGQLMPIMKNGEKVDKSSVFRPNLFRINFPKSKKVPMNMVFS